MQPEPVGRRGFQQVRISEHLQRRGHLTGRLAGQGGDGRQGEHGGAGQAEQPEYPGWIRR